jgi:hypothetical protein
MVESQILIAELKSRGSMTAADWDGDGKPDLLNSAANAIYLLRSVGSGGSTPFAPPQKMNLPQIPVIGDEVAIAVMDVNGDGDQDLILAGGHNYHCFFERSFLEHGYAEGKLLKVENRKAQ